jgi:hypothetical protein
MPGVIVSLQVRGEGKRVEKYLRAEAPDATLGSVLPLVKAMLKKPSDHEIGVKYTASHGFKRGKRAAPALRSDEVDQVNGGEPAELTA